MRAVTASHRRSARVLGRLTSALAAVIASLALLAGTAAPASASYSLFNTDSWAFWDGSHSSVYTAGSLSWYKDGVVWPVVRGQVDRGSWVALQRQGCLWVKVSYTTLTGSVSWPPSGGTNTVSDGYYRVCGEARTGIYLNGIAYASRSVQNATICVGYSTYASYELRRFDACKKVWSY